jgi:DNA-binding CsgD family transcriptional regulator
LTAYVVPVRSSLDSAMAEFLTRARAVVLVVDALADQPPDPALVRDVLGLTLAEARVAALVGSGQAPRGAAEKLGITEETARTVLKRVFAKVGVSRQSELASLLTKLMLR